MIELIIRVEGNNFYVTIFRSIARLIYKEVLGSAFLSWLQAAMTQGRPALLQ